MTYLSLIENCPTFKKHLNTNPEPIRRLMKKGNGLI
jgi:hypothetical protein